MFIFNRPLAAVFVTLTICALFVVLDTLFQR
jgi:hypothetical protein